MLNPEGGPVPGRFFKTRGELGEWVSGRFWFSKYAQAQLGQGDRGFASELCSRSAWPAWLARDSRRLHHFLVRRSGDRPFQLSSGTASEYGRYVESRREPRA